MEIILSKDHLAHFPAGEIYDGKLVRPFECPERWDHIVDALNDEGFLNQSKPNNLDVEKLFAVHEKKYVDFLKTCWDQWISSGYTGEAIPTIFPVRGFHQDRIPDDIDGKLGYYALAAETSITELINFGLSIKSAFLKRLREYLSLNQSSLLRMALVAAF